MNDACATAALLRVLLDEGIAPETVELDHAAYMRLRSRGDTRPASEPQIRRVFGLARSAGLVLPDGTADREHVAALVLSVTGVDRRRRADTRAGAGRVRRAGGADRGAGRPDGRRSVGVAVRLRRVVERAGEGAVAGELPRERGIVDEELVGDQLRAGLVVARDSAGDDLVGCVRRARA